MALLLVLVIAWVGASSLGTNGTALAQIVDFEFVNGASSAITGVYISPTDVFDWGSNVLSEDIRPGETRGFAFSADATTCVYDIRATFALGNPVEFTRDLCANKRIEFGSR